MSARHLSERQFAVVLNGCPTYLGTITTDSAAAKNNADTAVPFNDGTLAGKAILIQVSGACYVLPQTADDGETAATDGIELAAKERVLITMTKDAGWLSVIRATTDVTVKCWELR